MIGIENKSGRDPLAATNGAESTSPRAHSAAVTLAGEDIAYPRVPLELASLPELFRARRITIDAITVALRVCGELEDDSPGRDVFFRLALEESQALDALEEMLAERTRQ